ncbi:hypothetical protein GCM10017687_14910 [Streptomyces echinatus]
MGLTATGPATVLAVDAGNSKTDVAVVTAAGEVLATARGGGFRPPAVGVPAALDALAGPVARALADAGVPAVSHVSACLANADLPVEEERLAAALHARGWGRIGGGPQRHLRDPARGRRRAARCGGGVRGGHQLRGHAPRRPHRPLSGHRPHLR